MGRAGVGSLLTTGGCRRETAPSSNCPWHTLVEGDSDLGPLGCPGWGVFPEQGRRTDTCSPHFFLPGSWPCLGKGERGPLREALPPASPGVAPVPQHGEAG